MIVSSLSHVAISVRDMDRSLAFYRDIVGLEVTVDQEEVRPQVFRRRAVYLRWTDSSRDGFIVLDQDLEKPAVGQPTDLYELGVHHFAFYVDDLDSIAERARSAETPMIRRSSEPAVKYGELADEVVHTLLLRDPDGNVVQFDQWDQPRQ